MDINHEIFFVVILSLTLIQEGLQCVGQTNQQVLKGMNSHRFDINNYDDEGYATNKIAIHFNSGSHSVNDLTLRMLGKNDIFFLFFPENEI